MNIEKTECDRLGYEYKSLLEQVVYALHHIPYAKDFISEERLKKLNDLCLKLSTGDCEIIEFKRTLCKYDFTDILKEKDVEIDRLNNIIDTMLEFSFFKEECPLNFGFGDEKEEKAQDVFYEDDYCEENCNDIYKKCWLKYFEKLQTLKETNNV